MRIYAIRHGLTELNKKGIINGHIPDKLAPEGREQAELASKNLPHTIKHIYSSPLTRAKQTAEILNAKLQVPITYHEELEEVNFGRLEWTPFLDKYKQRHINLDYDWRPSGENFDDVKKRVLKVLAQVREQTGDGEALIVAHGGIIRMLTFLEQGTKISDIDNATLFDFDLDKILAKV